MPDEVAGLLQVEERGEVQVGEEEGEDGRWQYGEEEGGGGHHHITDPD